MGHLGFYFTNNKNKTVELPIAPADFNFARAMDNKSASVMKLGEVNQIGVRKLYSTTIVGSLPVRTKQSALVTARRPLATAVEYLRFFKKWQSSKKPGRLIITNTDVNVPITIENIEHGMKDGNDSEYVFSLEIKEWRDYSTKKMILPKSKKAPKKAPRRPAPKRIGVGSIVTVNGRLHRDSYGSGPGQTERNAKRKINFTNPGAPYPYHVTTLSGGFRGWVRASEVK